MQAYIEGNVKIYDSILHYLESEDSSDEDFQNLIKDIDSQKYEDDGEKTRQLLLILNNVSENHHRDQNFIQKVKDIIKYYKKQIRSNFTNNEIYNTCRNNKVIYQYLLNTATKLTVDIYYSMKNIIEPNGNRYYHFFYEEIKNFLDTQKRNREFDAKAELDNIERELKSENPDIFDTFLEKNKVGENDSIICTLIRQDSIDEFIQYVNKFNINLDSEIMPSIFETNSFLIQNKSVSLIEYSAFFGSIQIFNYLRLNRVELNPSLWIYAIHSKNAELIQLLESIGDIPQSNLKCLIESIKCHHNDITNYILFSKFSSNIFDGGNNWDDGLLISVLKYHNYCYFPTNFTTRDDFYFLCTFNYKNLVNLFLLSKNEEIEEAKNKISLFFFN